MSARPALRVWITSDGTLDVVVAAKSKKAAAAAMGRSLYSFNQFASELRIDHPAAQVAITEPGVVFARSNREPNGVWTTQASRTDRPLVMPLPARRPAPAQPAPPRDGPPEPRSVPVRGAAIRWEPTPHGFGKGHVGAIPGALWTISWSTKRNDPKPYVLHCSLPGIRRTAADATLAQAKARAERQLRTFRRMLDSEGS